MDRAQRKRVLGVIVIVASILVSVTSAAALAGTVRWVEIVALFGGGFGAGAATTQLIVTGTRHRREAP